MGLREVFQEGCGSQPIRWWKQSIQSNILGHSNMCDVAFSANIPFEKLEFSHPFAFVTARVPEVSPIYAELLAKDVLPIRKSAGVPQH